MWLWVNANDPLTWGTHTISASEGGTSITATVTAVKVEFDPGDNLGVITCKTPGTSRPWNPNELMDKHSPSKCEHTYLKTNTLGEVHSRYEVNASVYWEVTWSSSLGESGSFTTATISSTPASIHVGEIRIVQVGG